MKPTDMRNIPYFDGHCDTVSANARYVTHVGHDRPNVGQDRDILGHFRANNGHLDFTRLGRFQKAAQVFALFADAARFPAGSLWPECRRQHEVFLAALAENADLAVPCRTAAEIEAANASGRAAALLSVEGGELMDCAPERLETAAFWGVKLVNITWNHVNGLAGTNAEATDRGLTDRGRAFVGELYRLGMLPDVSHLSDPGFWDLAEMGLGPLIASHSNARALCPNSRNLTDDMFRAIRDSGGVVGINMYDEFIGGGCELADAVRHIDHFMDLDGAKTVALGGDWDGCRLLAGWHGIQDLPHLWDALAAHGYDRATLEDIFYNNWYRVLGGST